MISVAIVDDNLVFMKEIREELECEYGNDISISFFQNFDQLKKIDRLEDFYIIDYNLEDDQNGFDVIGYLKEKGFKGKIIVASGEYSKHLELLIKAKYSNSLMIDKMDFFRLLSSVKKEIDLLLG